MDKVQDPELTVEMTSMNKADRKVINRKNAQKSTGPKTQEGKDRSRCNALKHGLRAEVIPLPDEDPAEIQARSDAWNDYYKPRTPAEQHLVNECVRATLLSDRCDRSHAAALCKRVGEAQKKWEEAREDEVEAFKAIFKERPGEAVRGLWRSAHGCRSLLARWRALGETLRAKGSWSEDQCNEAVRLLGYRQENEVMKAYIDAYLPHFYNLLAQESRHESNIRWLLGPSMRPGSLPAMTFEQVPGREFSRAELRKIVDENVARLAEREEVLRTEVEEPGRAEAAERAMMAEDDRLFLRYRAEARSAFHRNYRVLVKSLAEDVSEWDESEPDEVVSPNEQNPPEPEAAEEIA